MDSLRLKVTEYLRSHGWLYKKREDGEKKVFKKKADSGMRQKIQKFGSFMGGMIMPTIGVFIAWGLWASAFIYNSPTSHGWFTTPELGKLVSVGIKWLLPLLIAINAGKMIYGIRGATIAAFLTIVIIVGTTTIWNEYGAGQTVYEFKPDNFKYYAGQDLITSKLDNQTKYFIVSQNGFRVMGTTTFDERIGQDVFNGFAGRDPNQIIGAMVVGPLGAKAFKTIEENYIDSVKPGFEMLIRNFSLAIIAILLGLILFYVWPWIMYGITILITLIIQGMGQNKYIYPVLTIFTEPLRTIFLNNALNYGVMVPLGLNDISNQQIQGLSNPHSIYYMYAGNAGPGLGLLLSFVVWKKGSERANAAGASLVEFVGGIHEVYYVYVVQKPIYIISTILGAASSMTVLSFAGGGTSSVVSPGSIISVVSTSPTPELIGINVGAVILGVVVTFIVASIIQLLQKKRNNQLGIEEQTIEFTDEGMTFKSNNSTTTTITNVTSKVFSWASVKKLVVACDAGMGSSTMAAGIIRKWVKTNNINIEVTNCALKDLPSDADVIVTTNVFEQFAKDKVPSAYVYSVEKFLDKGAYDQLYKNLKEKPNEEIKNTTVNVENKTIEVKKELDNNTRTWFGRVCTLSKTVNWLTWLAIAGSIILLATSILFDQGIIKYLSEIKYNPNTGLVNGIQLNETIVNKPFYYDWSVIAFIIFACLTLGFIIWGTINMFMKKDSQNVLISKKENYIFASILILISILIFSLLVSICVLSFYSSTHETTMFYGLYSGLILSMIFACITFIVYKNKNNKKIKAYLA